MKNRQIIDTHCHLQMSQFDADRDEVIRRALDAGIGMVCVGVDLESSRQAIALAERYEGIGASVGLHPNEVGDVVPEFATLMNHPKVVAVGEIGLDYYRSADRREEQLERFKKFLTTDKPLIIHCRDSSTSLTTSAHEDMLAILPHGRGVVHSFTGTPEQAMAYVQKGYHIGFNGIITFARQYDEVVRQVPLDRILLETDAPYLAPMSQRGKRNEPSYIGETARKIAELKGVDISTVTDQTTSNAKSLFFM